MLWKMPVTQISKLKAGSLVEAGTGIPLNSESPSHGLTFHPPARDSGSGRWAQCQCALAQLEPAPHTQAGSQGLSGTMGRD